MFLRWKGVEATPDGDFFVRSGPGTVKLSPDNTKEYIRTRWSGSSRVEEVVAPAGILDHQSDPAPDC